jgi:ferredoxin
MAPFMVGGSSLRQALKIPGLRLKAIPERCTGCRTCNQVCPMGLDAGLMGKTGKTFHKECILCGRCADSCPSKALELRFLRG